eukprot:1209027-Pyramimonas_sp.AAC.1
MEFPELGYHAGKPARRYSCISLFLSPRSFNSRTNLSGSDAAPSTGAQSLWSTGMASCGDDKTEGGRRFALLCSTTAAPSGGNLAMDL